jgi:hypothetical protein
MDLDASTSPTKPRSLRPIPDVCVSASASERIVAVLVYPQLLWLRDVLIGLEQTANVHCLSPPEVPVDAPVERELQRATVEATACWSVLDVCKGVEVLRAQNGGFAGHG